jgi:dTDP-4-dehydrorhamnose 3,5-epimerase
MKLEATRLAGLLLIRPEKHADSRGFFARLWCAKEFRQAGTNFVPCQISASFNPRAGTLRGLHWQTAPHAETKLVRVTQGRVWDVAVDLRPGSPTRLVWFGVELDAADHLAVLIPPGFAHGFVTLTDDAELLYCIDAAHQPDAARGARHDDPAFDIAWPRVPGVIAEQDLAWPAFTASSA